MREHGDAYAAATAEFLESLAAGLEREPLIYTATLTVPESLWRLSPTDARAEVQRRLEHKVAGELAQYIARQDRFTAYRRTLPDGTPAPPEAAGKRIGEHHMTARFLLVPLPPPREGEH